MRNEIKASKKLTIDNRLIPDNIVSNGNGGLNRAIPEAGEPSTFPLPGEPESKEERPDAKQLMRPNLTDLWRLWSETDRRIDALSKSVKEGVQVDEASNFCRWLQFSRVLEILEPYDQDVPLPIRGAQLRLKVADLLFDCGEWYRGHARSNKPREAYVSQSKLAAIEAELVAIKNALGLRSTATTEAVESVETALHVLPAGH